MSCTHADAFLEAKAKDRRDLLLKLINLEAYQRLGELATRKKNEAERERKGYADKLADIPADTEVILEAARDTAKRLDEDITRFAEQIQQTQEKKTRAEAAKQLADQVATLREAVNSQQELLDQAEAIQAEARRYQTLEAIIPRLQRLQDARDALAGAATKVRLHQEKIEELQAGLIKLAETVTTTTEALQQARTDHEQAATAEREVSNELIEVRQRVKTLREQLAEHQVLEGASACPTCGADVSTPEGQERVAAHYRQMAQRLEELQVDIEERRAHHLAAQARLGDTGLALNNAEKAQQGAAAAQQKQQTLLKREQDDLYEASQKIPAATSQVEDQLAALSADWGVHPATEDASALDTLHEEKEGLSEAPARAAALQQALQEVSGLRGQIQTLEAQRNAMPEAIRSVNVVQLQADLEILAADQKARTAALAETQKKVGRLEKELELRTDLLTKHDEAERLRDLYKKLATAFGPLGLQARIMRDAQTRVRIAANEALQRLSGCTWEIELKEDGEELIILAKDNSQPDPDRALRAFEYLSGGERFRVAVALAVGIGQSVTGGQTADSLLIDEGFGALDDDGRALMVEELHRLSQEVLGDGRVIVVSHQEDVQDQFLHRYRVSKHEGRARIERATPQDEAIMA